MKRAAGYSLIELLIAIALVAVVAAVAFAMINASGNTFAAQPEAADMQQRLRVAADALTHDGLAAGAGAYAPPMAGPLNGFFAPVLPEVLGSDPPGTFRADAITVLYVSSTSTQGTIANAMSSVAQTFRVRSDAGCPVGKPACGFAQGDTAVVYDAAGHFDTFSVDDVAGDAALVTPSYTGTSAVAYAPGAKIVKAVVRAYSVATNATSHVSQLVAYEPGSSSAAVVDHLVGLRFAYFGDPRPPMLLATGDTTYGPRPPAALEQTTAYPPGENCAFRIDAGTGQQVPRGAVLADSDALVPLTQAQLTDGPWCPDEASPHRFDLDLLRVRSVAVTIRVESSIDALRGPAGALFARGGTGANAAKLLPDQEITLRISPRNLVAER